MLAQFYATKNGSKILGVTESNPPCELGENDFELTPEEYEFLRKYRLDKAEILIKSIRSKMETETK